MRLLDCGLDGKYWGCGWELIMIYWNIVRGVTMSFILRIWMIFFMKYGLFLCRNWKRLNLSIFEYLWVCLRPQIPFIWFMRYSISQQIEYWLSKNTVNDPKAFKNDLKNYHYGMFVITSNSNSPKSPTSHHSVQQRIMKGYRKSHSKDHVCHGNIKCICEEFISLDDDDNLQIQ